MKKRLLFLGFGILLSMAIQAQRSECLKDFDYLIEKIKTEYPGYSDKVSEAALADLKLLEQELRNRMIQYPDSCGTYLNLYVSWFNDFHLRVRRNWVGYNRSNTEELIGHPSFYNISLDSICNSGKSIEGIWIGYRGQIAITDNNDGDVVGIALQYPNYARNQAMFEFTKLGTDEFNVTPFDTKGEPKREAKASLHSNNKVLEIHGDTRFVRQTSDETLDRAFLYSYEAKYPNGSNTYLVATYLSDSTYYLRIPSFDSDYSNDVVTQHWKEITSRPNLIIDIRNNGGGQDNYYRKLAELIYTNPYESKGVDWYATKGNIKLYEDLLKNEEILKGEEVVRETMALLAAMKSNPGGFVTIPIYDTNIEEMDSVYLYPKKIGIIINEGNGSSAEQFLLAAKNSKKVILFGNQNTAGVLDYSNAVSETFPSGNYKLHFPMTRSQRLPEFPIDNIGIAPDIIIPYPSTEQLYDRLDDWAYFVRNYLEFLNENE